MEIGIVEMLDAEIWKKVHDEGWRMWKEGMDRIRKTENGLQAAMAKQLMLDAERILRIPLRMSVKGEDNEAAKKRYRGELERKEGVIVKDEFEKAVKEGM